MPPLAQVEASNNRYAPSNIPTAVFVGGTQGIGRAMVEWYARHINGRANIFLVARSEAKAKAVLASLPTPPTGEGIKHEFIQCDAKEMKNVYTACEELKTKLSDNKINFLVMSVGGVFFRAQNTEEGNDIGMAQRYYCRAKFTVELLPLLENAKAKGEDARVLTILGAAKGREVDLSDPGLKNWTMARAMVTSGTYNDIMVKALSDQHPNLAFVHITPGFVDTPGSRLNWFFSLIITIGKLFGKVITAETAAQWMLYPLLSPEYAKGGYWMDDHAEAQPLPGVITEEVVQTIWEHTLEVIKKTD